MQFSFLELWAVMGPFAKGVVLLLLGMSLASFAIAGERLLAIRSVSRDLERFIPEWRAVLGAGLAPELRREAYDRSVRRTMVATTVGLRRGLAVIAGVGSTAPFVGLVGTVLGIVNAFQTLAVSGGGGVGEVSAGIAEALVTTAFGIGVAIPAVWLFNLLGERVRNVIASLECRAQDLAVAALRESL